MKQREMDSRVEQWGQVEWELSKLSSTLHEKTFCKHLIGSVNVATAYRDDVDEVIEKHNASVLTSDRHSKVDPEELSRKWNIGLETAKATLDVTTQHGVRTAEHPMSRRLRVDHLHLHRPRLKGTWYLDTLIAKARQMWIQLHTAEQGRKNQNHVAEREIGFLSKCWKLWMQKKNVYSWLWDYSLVYEGELLTRMSRGDDGRSGYEQVTGKTPDISEWLDFEFYDLVWWWDRPNKPNINDKTK
jgi:hypothetical protein